MPPRSLHRHYRQHPLKPKVDSLPTSPGIYLMKNADGAILYIGKAVNLRARVRSYFNGTDTRPRMHRLMAELVTLEVNLTHDEREALLLEARLIRQYQPAFNVALKGGARPTSIRLDLTHAFPRLDRGEQISDGARWFGPVSSAWRAVRVIELLERQYQLRTCSDLEFKRTTRPCLQYQLKRCPAPCAAYISTEEYALRVQAVVEVLEGGEAALAEKVRIDMQQAAEQLEFEQAAWLRDRLEALLGLTPRTYLPVAGVDRDVLGLARHEDDVAITLVPVRWGRQQQSRTFAFHQVLETSQELLTTLLLELYAVAGDLPQEIVLPEPLDTQVALEAIFRERAGGREVRVLAAPDVAGLHETAEAAARAELVMAAAVRREHESGGETTQTGAPKTAGKKRNARKVEPSHPLTGLVSGIEARRKRAKESSAALKRKQETRLKKVRKVLKGELAKSSDRG